MKEISIPKILEKFDFVNWDRYTESMDWLNIFGWIARPSNNYQDFVLLQINKLSGRFFLSTSSAERHDEIFKILDMKTQPNCLRVEHKWDIENSIKLK